MNKIDAMAHRTNLRSQLSYHRSEAIEVDRRLREFEQRWRRDHPLSPVQRQALIVEISGGGNLCCETGWAALDQILDDPIWIEHIHDWAYDRLSCRPPAERGTKQHAEDIDYNLKKLKSWLAGDCWRDRTGVLS